MKKSREIVRDSDIKISERKKKMFAKYLEESRKNRKENDVAGS